MYVQLNVNHLKAALICAAKNDIRHYLNGILIDVRQRDALIVSTDGHRICVIQAAKCADGDADNVPAQIIIPRDSLKGIKPIRGCVDCVLEYTATASGLWDCTIKNLAEGGRTFQSVDARYPDYSRVIPNKAPTSTTRAAFNPFYVADFTDLVRLLTGSNNTFAFVHEDGDSCALVTCDSAPEFVGALMPMRFTAPEFSFPSWFAPTQAEVEERKAA